VLTAHFSRSRAYRHHWPIVTPWLCICAGVFSAVVFLTAPTMADVGPAGEWVATGPPALPQGSGAFGSLVTLPDGSALLVGKLVQRYIPSTGSWTSAGTLLGNGGVATVLANGKVLVTGLSPAEVYDPTTQTSALTGAMVIPRTGHQATLLASGDVLVSGGADMNHQLVGAAEIYGAGSGTWAVTGTVNNSRQRHTAILLTTGRVLAVGGSGVQGNLTSAELYDPTAGLWAFTSSNSVGGAASTLLASGRALVVGSQFPSASQLFDSASATWSPILMIPTSLTATVDAESIVTLNDGRALLVFSSFSVGAGPL
jgi:hypothetical protein